MKTLVLGLIFLGLANLSFSQNELAYLDITSKIKFNEVKKASNNADFLNSFASIDISKRILTFQKVAANFDIKKDPVYTRTKPTTYTVTFKESNNEIKNIYSQKGKILSSNQTFTEVRLPYAISSKITKEHPEWAINQVDCTIVYTEGKAVNIAYKVKLKKGNHIKTIKFRE